MNYRYCIRKYKKKQKTNVLLLITRFFLFMFRTRKSQKYKNALKKIKQGAVLTNLLNKSMTNTNYLKSKRFIFSISVAQKFQ